MRLSTFVLASALSMGCAARIEQPTVDEASRRLAASRCAYELRCSPLRFSQRWTSVAQCETRSALDYRAWLASPHANDAIPTAIACVDALDGLEGQACGSRVQSACVPPPGKQPEGGICRTGFDCASKACVGPATFESTGCGVCAAASPPLPCGACGDDEVCTSNGCTPRPREGESCTVLGCAYGLACIADACRPFLATGARCDGGGKCDPDRDVCDPSSAVCAPPRLAKAFEVCGSPSKGFIPCGPSLTCSGRDTQNEVGTCIPAAEDGEACDRAVGIGCHLPSRCIGGVCTLPSATRCVTP